MSPSPSPSWSDAGVETLFVWGGDGTVQQCIDALRSAPPALAILPAGTANLFAGNLGVPTDLEAAVGIGLGGRRRTLDLGTVNDERFGVMAGVGFDAEMIRTAEAGLKDRLGRLGYVVAGALGLQRDAVPDARHGRRRRLVRRTQHLRARRQHGRRVRGRLSASRTPVPTTGGWTSGS